MISLVAIWPLAMLSARIAIIASSNESAGQADLRYANRDGARMATVLAELGAFSTADIWALPNTSAAGLRDALDRAERAAVREAGSEIVLYYSGHADAEGLLLKNERFTYRELRERLARSHAQVRVAVLDACNSGSATRPKGGRPADSAPFTAVEPVRVNGAAILAASSADELAQESSDISGSYFTHHLISGLRGAGDRDANGQVTLGEAYAYVYARTLATTVPSLWGPQHPSYDYALSGTGDLVLTTLNRGHQGITFAPGVGGTYTVLDAGREVVAETRPDPRRTARIALPAGRYRVAFRDAGRAFATDVILPAGVDVAVDRVNLEEVNPAYALAKGGTPEARNGLFADFALVGRGLASAGVSSEVGLGFRHNRPRWSLGPRVSYSETNPEDVGLQFRLRRVSGAAYLLRRIGVGPVELQTGASTALTRVAQGRTTGRDLVAWVPALAGVLALEMPIGQWLGIRIAWDAGAELVKIDGTLRLRPEIRAALGVGVRR